MLIKLPSQGAKSRVWQGCVSPLRGTTRIITDASAEGPDLLVPRLPRQRWAGNTAALSGGNGRKVTRDKRQLLWGFWGLPQAPVPQAAHALGSAGGGGKCLSAYLVS